ncbi:MAG: hypothetical protein V7K54_22440 [Nostoc sp.]
MVQHQLKNRFTFALWCDRSRIFYPFVRLFRRVGGTGSGGSWDFS